MAAGDKAGAAVAEQTETWTRVRKFVAGYASGVSLVLVGHPFDTIKVRLQAEGASGKFKGVWDCVKTTVVKEGPTGLYKGMAAPLVMTGVVNSLLFGMHYNFVTEIAKIRGHERPELSDTCAAAVASGALISLVVTPMEGIKARLQVQYNAKAADAYKGPVDCARRVYGKLGLRNGIYRGWLPVALSRMSNYSYFGAYAVVSASIASMIHGGEAPEGEKLPFIASFVAGGASGISYWLSCYPIDVVKNKIQSAPDVKPPKYASMSQAFRSVYRAEGLRGFFVGFTPCALRAFPANAAAFIGFEAAMWLLPE